MTTAVPKRKNVIPLWVSCAHHALLLGGLTFYCFLVYALVRPLFATFGFNAATTTKSVVAVILLTAFVAWLFPLIDAPFVIFFDWRTRTRARKGRCTQCGYPRPSDDIDAPCSECGASGRLPAPWQPTLNTLARFALLLLFAIVLGSVLAEWQLLSDERLFQQQASRKNYPEPGDSYTQSRAWPSSYATMTYTLENGAVSDPILESQRIRKWMRQD